MTDNITVAMVIAARDLAEKALAGERAKGDPEADAEVVARVFRTIYRGIAESVYHSAGGRENKGGRK